MNMKWNIGDSVIVLDKRGEYECRGTVVGRYAGGIYLYDIQPARAESMAKRLCGVPESQLRSVGKPIRAYERGPLPKPVHILDEA